MANGLRHACGPVHTNPTVTNIHTYLYVCSGPCTYHLGLFWYVHVP